MIDKAYDQFNKDRKTYKQVKKIEKELKKTSNYEKMWKKTKRVFTGENDFHKGFVSNHQSNDFPNFQ
jgi:hypothetical protein